VRIRSISHVAIGVSDMARSLAFYRDVLGLKVMLEDPNENPGGVYTRFGDGASTGRHAAYLRWEEGDDATTIVLSEDRPSSGKPVKLNQVGIHHFAFWVDDLRETVRKAELAGVRIMRPPEEFDTITYGEPAGRTVLTVLLKDPDGVVVQLDQRV